MAPVKTRSLRPTTHKKKLIFIYGIGVLFFALLISFVSRRLGNNDDTVFQLQVQHYPTALDWIIFNYHNWSGRIFPELFIYLLSPAPLYLWKLVSIFMYALSSGLLFAYSKLIPSTKSNHKEYILLGASLLVPYIVDPGVVFDGALWVTGSMNYFWITTLGLLGIYPIVHYAVRQKYPNIAITILGLISGSIAACSQEQVGLVLVTFTGIFVIYQLYKHLRDKRINFPVYHFAILALFTGLFLFSVLAPGNSIRDQIETLHWLPDFHTATLMQHVNYGYRWVLSGLINNGGALLTGAWVLLIALFFKKQKKDKWDISIMVLLTIAALLTLAKGHQAVGYWFNFYNTWRLPIPNKIAYLPFISWAAVIATTVVAPIVLYRKNYKKGVILSLMFSAAIASSAVITLSPTMYASGVRTLYVSSVILELAILVLSVDVLDKFTKIHYLIISSILAFAASEYILLLLMVLNKTP